MAVRQKRPLTLLFADFKSVFRTYDTVARLGGDEFVAVAFDIADGAALEARLESVVREFNATAGADFRLGASVGSVALAEGSNETLDQLLARGDEAMYRAKRAKRS